MLIAISQRTTESASLRRVSRIDVFNDNSCRLSLVLDKGLELPESPTVQAGSDASSAFDVLSDVSQILKNNFTRSKTFGFLNNGFAHFVVRVFNSPLLFTRDLPERLSCALTAVGLQATAKRKVFVSAMPKIAAAEEIPCTRGGKVVFSDINPQNGFRLNHFYFGKFQNQVEKPVPIPENKFRFLGSSIFKKIRLAFSSYPFDFDSTSDGIEGKKVPLKRVSSFIKMDTGSTEVNFWNAVLFDFLQRLLRFIGFTNAEDSVAAHLRTKRSLFPQIRVNKIVQCYPVPTSVFDDGGNQEITSMGISRLQFRQGFCLLSIGSQFKGNSLQHLSSLGNMFGTLNILFDCVGAYMSRCSNIVRRRPQVSAPQTLFENREADEQPSTGSAFEYFHRIGDSNRRRNTQKQVNVVRLNFTSQCFPFPLGANLIQKFFKRFSHFTSQNVVPILRTPHNVIRRLIHTISVCSNIFHISHSTPCDAACQAAIPPLIKIRGFLAEGL
jgi:hypothetical protein